MWGSLILNPITLSRINPSGVEERKLSWQKLSGLLRTYERLYCADQVFLLEVGMEVGGGGGS